MESRELEEASEALLAHNSEHVPYLPTAEVQDLVRRIRIYCLELETRVEELQVAEADMERDRDRSARLVDGAPNGFLGLDDNGRVVVMNNRAVQMLGGGGQLRSTTDQLSVCMSEGSALTWMRFLELLHRYPVRHHCELRLAFRDGEERVTYVEGCTLQSGGAANVRYAISLSDLTEYVEERRAVC